MTDDDVEEIIKRNMNLQMNLAGIRADFEDAQQRTWVGLADEEISDEFYKYESAGAWYQFACAIEAKLKEKNT